MSVWKATYSEAHSSACSARNKARRTLTTSPSLRATSAATRARLKYWRRLQACQLRSRECQWADAVCDVVSGEVAELKPGHERATT
jgi:hypothetical protein